MQIHALSPASICQIIRHSNGKYYWLGNISAVNVRANLPRDVLSIGEIDEKTLGLRQDTLFVIDRSRLVLNASHTHSGPVTGDVLRLYFDLPPHEDAIIDRYTKWLLDRVVDAIGQAIADLAPAKLAFGQGLAGIAVNRRRARAGGRVLPPVVDQDVPVLTVRSPSGELRGIVFGYACHTTCPDRLVLPWRKSSRPRWMNSLQKRMANRVHIRGRASTNNQRVRVVIMQLQRGALPVGQ